MPGPTTLQIHTEPHTHTHSVLFCMCVYCHLAIRLRDSGVSQVRYITGLGPVADYRVFKFCWAKWQTVPWRNMQCKQRWNKANHASNCRVATIIENLLPPPTSPFISLPLHRRVTIINHLGVAAVAWCLTSTAASGHESGTLAGATGQTHTHKANTHRTHTPQFTRPCKHKGALIRSTPENWKQTKLFHLITNGFCSQGFCYGKMYRGVLWKVY